MLRTNTSTTAIRDQLTDRVRSEAGKADGNSTGRLDLNERNRMPADVRDVANYAADTYLSGGLLPISEFVTWYQGVAGSQLTTADRNRNGRLSPNEESALHPLIHSSVLALGTATTTPPIVPLVTTRPPSTSIAGAFGISGTVPSASVSLRAILDRGLSRPSGLAFNPRDGSLWVLNRGNDSSVVISSPGGSGQRVKTFRDDSDHFMNNPMGLAFSPHFNEFASVQETTNDYNSGTPGNMFMGPTLWPADATYDGGHGSHLDMLHHSPNSVGIAAGTDYAQNREYFVFNGERGSIDRYFFGQPHVRGGDDHADGQTVRYGAGSLRAAPGVPGQLAFDAASGILYIADTGKARIAQMDTRTGFQNLTAGEGHHDETPIYNAGGVPIRGVTPASAGLAAPSGLVIHRDRLVVADHATGHIKVFTKHGQLVGDLDTGLGPEAIGNLAVGPNGKLFLTDMRNNAVHELTVRS